VRGSTAQAQIDAAQSYETLMVSSLFGEWAPRVAQAAGIRSGQHVLDLACGTGVLAREAATRTGPTGRVVGLDPGPGMLEVARRLAPALEWRRGTAEHLPFPDSRFDAVISQFGLMFFDDRRLALREVARVLTPGGRMAIAVWDTLDRNPAYAAEVALLERMAGSAAADAVRKPFALGAPDALVDLVRSAGAESVEIRTQPGRARFPSVRAMVEADLRGWLPVMGITLPEDQITSILAEAEQALRSFVGAHGEATFATSAHIVVGSRSPG